MEMPGQMQNVLFESGAGRRLMGCGGSMWAAAFAAILSQPPVAEAEGRLPIATPAYTEMEELSVRSTTTPTACWPGCTPQQQSLAPRVLLRLVHVQEGVSSQPSSGSAFRVQQRRVGCCTGVDQMPGCW